MEGAWGGDGEPAVGKARPPAAGYGLGLGPNHCPRSGLQRWAGKGQCTVSSPVTYVRAEEPASASGTGRFAPACPPRALSQPHGVGVGDDEDVSSGSFTPQEVAGQPLGRHSPLRDCFLTRQTGLSNRRLWAECRRFTGASATGQPWFLAHRREEGRHGSRAVSLSREKILNPDNGFHVAPAASEQPRNVSSHVSSAVSRGCVRLMKCSTQMHLGSRTPHPERGGGS